MQTFKRYFNNVILLESPQGKIQKYGITDPAMINFIYRYEPLLKWQSIKSEEDINQAIEYKIEEITKPENYHIPRENINWKREREILKNAAENGNYEAEYSLQAFDSDPEGAKEQILNDLNAGKDDIINSWLKYFDSNEAYNKAFEFIVLSSLLKKADKSRNPPLVLNPNSLAKVYDKIQDKPKTSVKIKTLYDSFLKRDIENESETVISGEGTWVKIPGVKSDPQNIEENIQKLMSVAASNWCICQKGMATNYLKDHGDDFWLYLVDDEKGNKTAVASIRVNDGEIKEISGTEGGSSQDLHDKYLPVVSDIIEQKDFIGKSKYLGNLLIEQGKIDKIQKLVDIGELDLSEVSLMEVINKEKNRGNLKLIKMLLDNGVNTEGALYNSLKYYDLAEFLLKNGVNPNDKGWSALIGAIRNNDKYMVKLLLKYGADPNIQDGEAMLDAVNYKNPVEVLTLLINAGADFNTKYGRDTLNSAAFYGNIELVKLLLKSGAKPEHGELATAVDGGDLSKPSRDLVKILLDAGANPNGSRTALGDPLSNSIYRTRTGTYGVDITKMLLDAGADPNVHGGFMLDAFQQGNVEAVELLLKYGAEPKLTYPNKEAKELMEVIMYGGTTIPEENKVKILELLVDAGYKLPNPLLFLGPSVFKNKLLFTEFFLKQGANPNEDSHIMGKAMDTNNYEMVELLLKYGANPNDGLKRLRMGGQDEIARLLFKHGATHPQLTAKDFE